MNKEFKKIIIECLLGSLLVLLFAPLLYPVTDPWFEIYSSPIYWLFGYLSCAIISFIIVYFTNINSRKFYYCINIVPASIGLTLSTFSFITILVLISLMENICIKIVLLILVTLLYLFLLYVIIHRGICIYKNGKIRIFKFKIKTYNVTKIEDIRFEYENKKCNIVIIINGFKEEFVLSSFSAKLVEKRLKSIV
ncbi:MAG: hypothetical protein IJV94_00055 [Bacilli bacterium]|nr:hypothetical protein [Bacilli bacterium]